MLVVGGGVHGGGGDAGHDVAAAFADEAEHVELRHHAFHHGEDGFIERHVDHLPLAAIDLAVAHRHQRADHRPQRGDGVADGDAGAHRRAVLEAGDVAQAAHGFADGAEARLVLVRAGLAEAGQAHHHQLRVQFVDDVPTETELLQHAGAEVLDQDVRFGQQLLQHFAAVGMLEVERHRAFVARLHEPPQRGALVQLAPLAQRVAAIRRFDLDHFGTEFGTDPRGEGTGDQRAELYDFQTG
ncbi:hypothetical protein D3C76_772640 [compost metagenome]